MNWSLCSALLYSTLTQTVFTACELGVFDVLLGAQHPLSAEEVSQAVGASLDGTQRLLAACTGLQLLNTHQDNGQGKYMHTSTELWKCYITFCCNVYKLTVVILFSLVHVRKSLHN